MSHFTEAKTNLKEKERIKKILKNLGFTVIDEEAGVEVRGYEGQTIPADFKILTKHNYDIGFVKDSEGCYELVGDWELLPRVAGIEREDFVGKVCQDYAYDTIATLAEQNGFEIETEIDEETQEMQVVVTKW